MRPLLVLVALFALNGPADALKAPRTPQELAEVAAIDAAINAENTDYADKMQDRQTALEKARLKSIEGQAGVLLELEKIEKLKDHHREKMDSIIERTLQVYDLRPTGTDHSIGIGPFERENPYWSPRYGEQKPERRVRRDAGEVVLQSPGKYAGITWADGVVELNDKAFLNAKLLGAIIFHEMIHFEQLTTIRRAKTLKEANAELEAYSGMAGQAAIQAFGLTKADVDLLHSVFSQKIRSLQQKPQADFMSLQYEGWLDGLEKTKAGGQADFLRRESEWNDLKRENDRMWSEMKTREAVVEATAPQQSAVPIQRSEPRAVPIDLSPTLQQDFDTMRSLAAETCSSPGSLTEEKLRRFAGAWKDWQDILVTHPSLRARNIYEGLGGCQLALLTAVLTKSPSGSPGSAADRDWVVQLAYAQITPQPQPLPTRRATDPPKGSDITDIDKRRSFQDAKGWKKP